MIFRDSKYGLIIDNGLDNQDLLYISFYVANTSGSLARFYLDQKDIKLLIDHLQQLVK